MRVRTQGCDVKMFCFLHGNHARMNLKQVFELKTRQVYFIYPFPHRLKLGKSLQNMLFAFFLLKLTLLSKKNLYFRKPLFCKTRTDCVC